MSRFNSNVTGERMNQRWLPAKNVGSQEVPPHGVVEISTSTNPSTGVILHSVKRPTAEGLLNTLVAVNGPTAIPAGKYGVVTQDWPVFALYDTNYTPSVGEPYGTDADSFLLVAGRPGFTIVGQTLGTGSASRVRVGASFASDWWYAAFISGTLALNTPLVESSPLTTWATSAIPDAYPVFWDGLFNNNIGPLGWYRAHARLNVGTGWTQPDDNQHHHATILFEAYLDGTAMDSAYATATFIWPARRTSTDGAHTHGGAVASDGNHHHTFDAVVAMQPAITILGYVEKTSNSYSAIYIQPTVFSASTGGPVIGDFSATGVLEIVPIRSP